MRDLTPIIDLDKAITKTTRIARSKRTAKPTAFLLVGCLFLFWIGLLSGCNLASDPTPSVPAPDAPDNEASLDQTADSTEAPSSQETTPLAETQAVSDQQTEESPNTSQESVETAPAEAASAAAMGPPEMSSLTFALETTEQGEPVEPSFSFQAGVTQIHAIFEYTNLTPNDVWTQIWYHNGNEVLHTGQPWLKGESGLYDYLVEAGGNPIPPGQWALEFYVGEALLSAGSFVIESEATLTATTELTETTDILRVYRLAYTKWNGDKHDLYIGDTNGYNEQFVMSRAAGPSWSPDGRYIFFYGEEGVDQQVIQGRVYPFPGVTNGLARMEAYPIPTNIGQIRLFQGHGWNDGTARWANISPDGSMIAYDGDRGGGRRIYFLGTNANQQFRIEIIGEQADWSPDSQRIVFRSGRNNQTGIWIANHDGSGAYRLTYDGSDSFPTWSFDGQTIAFSRDIGGGNTEIYTVDLNGTNLTRLTSAAGHDTLPLYLPDGDLLFRSSRGGRWGIWKMKADGSEPTLIIPNAPVGPDWSKSRMSVLR